MEQRYSRGGLVARKEEVVRGDLVACLDPCSGSWRRARVLRLLDSSRVEVTLLDYGGVVALEKAFL